MRINVGKAWVTTISLVIYILLEYTYAAIVQNNYGEFRSLAAPFPVSRLSYFLSYAIPFLLTLFLLFFKTSDLIYCILNVILILSIYPCTILYRHLHTDYRIVALNVLYFATIYLASIVFHHRLRGPLVKEGQKIDILLVASMVLILPFVFVYGTHIDFSNFALDNIYESRGLQKELGNAYLGYTYYPLTNVFVPLLLLLSIIHKQYVKIWIALAMFGFMFLVGAHKSVFVGAILIIIFYFNSYRGKILVFFSGVMMVLILGAVLFSLNGSLFITSHFSHRLFYLPAILEVGYFKFFDGNPIFWSDSVLRSFVTYPFNLGPTYEIGKLVLGNSLTNANNGIVSDGFMNFGVGGSVFNILMVSLIFAYVDALNISHRFFGIPFLLVTIFASSFFFTALLTHGVALTLLVGHYFLKDTADVYT